MFVRLASLCGLVLFLHPVDCFRVNVKKVVAMKQAERSRPAVTTEGLNTVALDETVTNGTLSESDIDLPSSPDHVTKHDEMLDFMDGTQASKRTIGNMLASVGLVRARLVLSVSSSVMPASLANKVLPAAFVQQAPAAEGHPDSIGSTGLAMKSAVFLIAAAAIFVISNRLLDIATQSKMISGDGYVDPAKVRDSVVQAVKIAVPQVLMCFLYQINEIVSTVAVGRVGTKEQLAACGLCQMMMSAFLYCFTLGMMSPLDALVSTAWGAGDKKLCIAYVSKARLVGMLQVVWLVPILWNAESILLLLGQEPEVASHTVSFCRVLGVAYVPFYFNVSTTWLLKNIGDPMIGVWGLLLGNIVHIVLAIRLVVYGGWGNVGVAVAWSVNTLCYKLTQDIYLMWKSEMKDQGFVGLFLLDPQLCRTGVWCYAKLAIPSVFATGAESWFWEAVTMIIGSMSATALAAHVSACNVQSVLMMGPVGFVAASATVVGTLLGVGDIGVLRAMVTLFPMIAFTLWSVVFAFLMAFRFELAAVYSTEVDVQLTMATLLALNAVSGFFNSMQAVTSGCLKGMTRHKTVAYIVLGNFYLVSLPLAYIIGVKIQGGVYGVYVSFLIGLMMMFVCMTYTMSKVNLKEESEKAIARLAENKIK